MSTHYATATGSEEGQSSQNWFWCCCEGTTMSEPESLRCSSVRNRGGVQRVEGKLRASVEKGDYYEAHQMYRTLFFR